MVDVSYIFKNDRNYDQVIYYYTCDKLFRHFTEDKRQRLTEYYKSFNDQTKDIVLSTEAILFVLQFEYKKDTINKYRQLFVETRNPKQSYDKILIYINLKNSDNLVKICKDALFERLLANSFKHEKKAVKFYRANNCTKKEDIIKFVDFIENTKKYRQYYVNYSRKLGNTLSSISLIGFVNTLIESITKYNIIYVKELFDIFFMPLVNSVSFIEDAFQNLSFILDLHNLISTEFMIVLCNNFIKALNNKELSESIRTKIQKNYYMFVYDKNLTKLEVKMQQNHISLAQIVEYRKQFVEKIVPTNLRLY